MPSVQELIRQLPKIEPLVEKYATTSRGVASAARALEAPVSRSLRSVADGSEQPSSDAKALIEAGSRALIKVSKEGKQAKLNPDEQMGLEAIVLLEGRPAILVQEGKFFPAPSAWQVLEQQRNQIQAIFPSVGRIELTGHPDFDWLGTGFLVANDVIMTNRHVAQEFCRQGSTSKWKFASGMKPRIDYVEELGATNSAEFAIKSVIGIHERYDLALLRVSRKSSSGNKAPQPLSIRSTPPKTLKKRQVYTIGYPAWDGRRNDPVEMRKIFGEIFNVKRLQPGEVVRLEPSQIFVHDCSTLGGNSGSCVVDLETHQAMGLHFGGRYLEGNKAVALWELTKDPLIKKAKLNFV